MNGIEYINIKIIFKVSSICSISIMSLRGFAMINSFTFCKMMIYIDILIGHILDKINLDETIVIFTSDNGGQPGLKGVCLLCLLCYLYT